MVFKAKQKGSTFERDAVELLDKAIKGSKFRRIPGSGALGTTMAESLLTGDLSGKIDLFPKTLKGEAKCGYNSSSVVGVKQFTLKKEWMDKIIEEANNNYSLPFLIGKFSGARSGVKEFIVLDVETFATLINLYTELMASLE
ncbi:TPA: hypothetical protein DCQ22_03760 [Candidatus Nomurabacteria bacterium]|nr:hypothetical protein [Candidatus Nomurabacteria bacterium]HBY20749.1 hypothetical protein [Clostridiales bacterium]